MPALPMTPARWLAVACGDASLAVRENRRVVQTPEEQSRHGSDWTDLELLAAKGLTAAHVEAVIDRYAGLPGLSGPNLPAHLLRLAARGVNPDTVVALLRPTGPDSVRPDDLVRALERAGGLNYAGAAWPADPALLVDAAAAYQPYAAPAACGWFSDALLAATRLRARGLPDGLLVAWAEAGLLDVAPMRSDGAHHQASSWLRKVRREAERDAWAAAAPDYAAAGYGPDEAVRLFRLPTGHPDKPTSHDLAVMAGLSGAPAGSR